MPNINWDLHVLSDQVQIAQVSSFRFSAPKHDPCHSYILGREIWEESVSSFYSEVCDSINPSHVIDIGANYGLIGAIANRYMNDPKVIAVEPSPALQEYIAYNLYANGVKDFTILQGIASNVDNQNVPFYLNPNGNLDNRAGGAPEGWSSISVPSFSLASILESHCQSASAIFCKVDTQGHEPSILDISCLKSINVPWLIKTEFAPRWMEDASHDPVEFLKSLTECFDVVKNHSSYAWRSDYNELFNSSVLQPSDCEEFVASVAKQFRDRRGWCDLLIRPKS